MIDFTQFYFPDPVIDFLATKIFVFVGVVFDLWMVFHFLVGYGLRFVYKTDIKNIVILLTAFEVFEFWLFVNGQSAFESVGGRIVDIVFGTVGYWLATRSEK